MEKKVSRQQLVEKSREKFYQNLKKEYQQEAKAAEEGKVEEKKKVQRPKRPQSKQNADLEAVKQEVGKKNKNENETVNQKKSFKREFVMPKSMKSNRDLLNDLIQKDLNRLDYKQDDTKKNVETDLSNKSENQKSGPIFQIPKSKPSAAPSQPVAPQKKILSQREILLSEIQNHLHEPKKLQEIKKKYTHFKVDFESLVHQAKVQKMKLGKSQAAGLHKTEFVIQNDPIAKRIEASKKLLERLKKLQVPPQYAKSILQSARFDKSRILEAHLSSLPDEARKFQVNETMEKTGRTALMFACFHNSLEMVELLIASGAKTNFSDHRFRSCLHYAAMNDNPKQVETVFLGFKHSGEQMSVFGQKNAEMYKTLHHPKPTFSPFKSQPEELKPKSGIISREEPQIEEDIDFDKGFEEGEQEEGFEIEEGQAEREQFQVVLEGEERKEPDNKITAQLGTFFLQKQVEAEEDDIDELAEKMDLMDTMFVDELVYQEEQERMGNDELHLGPLQTFAKGILNFRDHHGRTPLHIAVAMGNKAVVETLCFLNANPLMEDIYGQRPIEMATDDAIKELLQNKMLKAQKLELYPVPKEKGLPQETIQPKPVMPTSTLPLPAKKVPLDQQQFPLDLKDLRLQHREKIMLARIGIDHDDYLQHAIKQKHVDAATYLFFEVGGFEVTRQNNQGNTAVHLAVRSGKWQLLKILFMEEMGEEGIGQKEMRGVVWRKGSEKALGMQNNKKNTPFLAAVDLGNHEIFRLLMEIYYHYNQQNPNFLSQIVSMPCDKESETALIKAIRLNFFEIANSLLFLCPEVYSYEMLLQTDHTQKNALHHSVIKQNKELIQKLVMIDSDKGQLRGQLDAKKKQPKQYDPSNLYGDILYTVWDAAKDGNVPKLQQKLNSNKSSPNDQTFWLKNTPLHIAVKHEKLEVIRVLVFEYGVDCREIRNANGKTPLEFAMQIKSVPLQNTVIALLTKESSSTKVGKDPKILEEKQREKKKQLEEINNLRLKLKQTIQERGLDLKKMFELFDKNGDGVFVQLEFECAFTALDIHFAKADLRRLIQLADSNRDGRIDFKEFHDMLYKDEEGYQSKDMEGIALDASFEDIS